MPGSRSSSSCSRQRSSFGGSSCEDAGRRRRPASNRRRARRWRSARAASGTDASFLRVKVPVRELELDLDAFEGPFDLLLALVLRDELDLGEVDVAGVVLAFVERLAERDELDLESCGEFLVLVAALLELKARALLAGEDVDIEDLDPAAAAEELAQRLAEYRRIKEAAAWLAERLEAEGERFFRLGPAPLAPQPQRRLAPQDPESLAATLRTLAAEPPAVSLAHLELRFPPVEQFLGRFRALLSRRTRFDFDTEVQGMTRVEQAVAFLALLELRKAGGIVLEKVAGGWAFRASREAAEACGRLFERPVERGLSAAALETLAVIAYLGPCSRPEVARLRGVAADSVVAGLVERGLIAEAGRDESVGAVRYRVTPLFERIFGLESLSELPRLDDLGADAEEIRGRLESLAEKRPA